MEPFFLEGVCGRLFCLYRPASEAVQGQPALLHLPAFAEEMNKSRRMVSLAAREFARHGIASMVFDPYGTGDSAGELSDASWPLWLSDAEIAVHELYRRGHRRIGLWGLRTGCLLAATLASSQDIDSLLLWQPVVNGERFLSQLLRLRVAAAKLHGDKAETVQELRAAIEKGETVDVAGYSLKQPVCAPLAAARLEQLPPQPTTAVHWFEVGGSDGVVARVSNQVIESWRGAGVEVSDVTAMTGEPFWNTQEISTAPNLVDRSVRSVARRLVA